MFEPSTLEPIMITMPNELEGVVPGYLTALADRLKGRGIFLRIFLSSREPEQP